MFNVSLPRLFCCYDPEILEALACREGLSLALDLNLTDIKLATDCKTLVSDISGGSNGKNAAVNKEIKQMSSAFIRCCFVHEGRLSNMEAHNLAKHALTLLSEGRHVWLLSPHDTFVIPELLPFDQ